MGLEYSKRQFPVQKDSKPHNFRLVFPSPWIPTCLLTVVQQKANVEYTLAVSVFNLNNIPKVVHLKISLKCNPQFAQKIFPANTMCTRIFLFTPIVDSFL